MTENLTTAERDGLPPSILAPARRIRVPVWVLVVAVVAAFALGWLLAAAPIAGAPSAAPAPTPTVTPLPEVDDHDDSAFVRVATRDLDDFDKDLDDIDTTLDENGFWRLLTNAIELNFNVSQLQGHEAPTSITGDWSDGLDQLADDVDAIEAGITARSDSRVRAAVAAARTTVAGLRGVVSRVD